MQLPLICLIIYELIGFFHPFIHSFIHSNAKMPKIIIVRFRIAGGGPI